MNQKPSPLHRASEWIVDHYRLFFVVFAALLVFSAVASGWVKVENDVAAYLPADSETRQGLDIMEQEFQTYGSAKILLRDTDADAAAATAEQIRAVDGVDSCTYTMNDTGSALLSVSLSDLEGSDTCAQTVQALRDEAHRFGITHHRLRRSKSQVSSELDAIRGIGPATVQALMRHFRSIRRLRDASLDDIAVVVGPAKARLVREHFKDE